MPLDEFAPRPGKKIRRFIDIKVPMRDSTNLSADITLPIGPGPFPTILMRSPYGNNDRSYLKFASFFVQHGYAFVIQDVRGRGDSDGEWYPFIHEAEDGYDTIEWTATQPWCAGKVGMLGGSYGALVQWQAAKEHPPHLAALSATASPGHWMEDGLPYRNGVLSLETLYWLYFTHGRSLQTALEAYEGVDDDPLDMNWPEIMYHLPLKTMDQAAGFFSQAWQDWLAHPTLDAYWKRLQLGSNFGTIELPVLHITGWFDDCLIPSFYFYRGMLEESSATDRQWLLVGPWDHHGTRIPVRQLYGEDFGPEAVIDMNALQLQFFDRFLKDEGNFDQPKVKLFVLGENEWRTARSWPPENTQLMTHYLDSGGAANAVSGRGRLDTEHPNGAENDCFVYDPEDPTPAWPDHSERWASQALSLDQRFVQERQDVLVYTSGILDEPLNVTGVPSVELYISSDAPDTDFYVTLSDVYPDGRVIRISWNAVCARFRESLCTPTLMDPGEVHELTLDLSPVCNTFGRGHRVQVDIRSANFPLHARNPNTGHCIGQDTELRVANQTVFHNSRYPSRILLPVIIDEEAT